MDEWNEWMNEWMNEWWMNNDRVMNWMDWMIDEWNEWLNDDEWMEWIEWMEWMIEWINNGWWLMNEWMDGGMEWMEWIEWMEWNGMEW